MLVSLFDAKKAKTIDPSFVDLHHIFQYLALKIHSIYKW